MEFENRNLNRINTALETRFYTLLNFYRTAINFNCHSFSLFSNDDCTSKIVLEGKSDNGSISQRGLGPIHSENMSCKIMSVYSTDVNDIYVNCSEKLNVEIYHSGDVYYKGHPEIKSYIAPNAQGKLISIDN